MSSLYLMGITATTAALEIIVGILYLLLNEQFFVVGFFFFNQCPFLYRKDSPDDRHHQYLFAYTAMKQK